MKVNQLKVMIRTLQLKSIAKKKYSFVIFTKQSNCGRNLVQRVNREWNHCVIFNSQRQSFKPEKRVVVTKQQCLEGFPLAIS